VALGRPSHFYAIGAYTQAMLLDKTGIPYWATVPIAGAISLGIGFSVARAATRRSVPRPRHHAMVVATPQILKFKGFD